MSCCPVATTACSSGDDGTDEQGAVAPAATTTTAEASPPPESRYHPHEFEESEVFDYVYDVTEATVRDREAPGGAVPRVTDLDHIIELRTRVRFTIVAEGDDLQKQVELIEPQYREITPHNLRQGAQVAFAPLQEIVPEFPETFTHTYPVDRDAAVAQGLNELFADYPDQRLFSLVDIFSFSGAVIGALPDGMAVGESTISDAVDVDLFGGTFHNHHSITLFDRVDEVNGVRFAHFSAQNPGNYFGTFDVDTNYQETFLVPLEGPAAGLVSTGDLQEQLVIGAAGPRTATIRQVSMTLQTDTVATDVDPGT